MYGLEKNKMKEFQFDLEIELKENPKKAKELEEKIKTRIEEIKALINEGASEEEIKEANTLLQGYKALQKIIDQIKK